MIFEVYKKLSNFLIPIVFLFFVFRLLKKKETLVSLKQKFGIYLLRKPRKKIIWLNAVSIGESLSVMSVIKEINKSKKYKILLTTSTTTSARIIKKRYPYLLIHQFAPLDIPLIINKFLTHWDPEVAIFSESELWPNLLSLTKQKGIKLVLLNGRMSMKTFENWSNFPKTSKKMLKKFDLSLIQDNDSYERFKKLGLENIKHVGNLKFISEKPPVSNKDFIILKRELRKKLVICVCSSHFNEEEIILETYVELKKKISNLFLIIIPRHISRKDEIKKIFKLKKINYSVRSEKSKNKYSECLLADTFGEVGLFLKISDIVLMGGSFIKKGGQNPIEASFFKCPTIIGPYHENFGEVVKILKKNDAILVANNVVQLSSMIFRLCKDDKFRFSLGENLFNTCNAERDKNIKILEILSKAIYKL